MRPAEDHFSTDRAIEVAFFNNFRNNDQLFMKKYDFNCI
jgi:hypothetical protein